MKYFTSDPHWGHKNTIKWGRPQFQNVDEMNKFLVKKHQEWAKKLKPEDQFWCLGDIFSHDFLWVYRLFNCKTVLLLGNHDRHEDVEKFKQYFDEVYEYPVYISDKVCVSHVPQAVFDDQINIYGHLHYNVIDKINYVSACLEPNDYQLVSEKRIQSKFSKMPKYTRKHLEAPYTEWEKVLCRPENDLILTPDKHIDVSAMRAIKWLEKHPR